MAAKTAKMLSDFDISDKSDRLLMNKLRDCGLEYVSSSGKVIPAKTQPEHFCHCPQKCKSKLSQKKWDELFERFYNLGDQNKQNQFLQSHILIKAVHLHNWETEKSPTNKRRVSCKYHVPNLSEDSDLEDYITRKGNHSIEVCQKAFMNCYGITEKRVRMQRERCISRLAPDHYKNSPFGKKHKSVPETESSSNAAEAFPSEADPSNTPLDLSNDKRRKLNAVADNKPATWDRGSEDSNGRDQPLDLSSSNNRSSVDDVEIDKASLYELARKMGLTREAIDLEMAPKYEEYLRKNLRKPQRGLAKNNRKRHSIGPVLGNYKTEIENRSPVLLEAAAAAAAAAAALEDTALCDEPEVPHVQTLNNGDLTITPVIASTPKPEIFETMDIMRVNSFFQNQLWQPELIGLSSWRKLRNQSFDI